MSKTNVDISPLLTPLELGPITLKNRFVMPGMQRAWCRDGKLLPGMADYYRRRVEGGVALIIGEGCSVGHWSSIWDSKFPRLDDDTLDGWKACADAVHEAGGHMLLQLSHPGAFRSESQALPSMPGPALSPSGLFRAGHENGRAATRDELLEIRDAFGRAAALAQKAGLDGVEVHGAHGFFLDAFLWQETNLRTDDFGGETIGERARYPAEVIAAVRAATSASFLISFRLSQWKEVDYGARIVDTPDELGQLLAVLEAAGTDIFHPSTRRYFKPEWPDSDLGFAGWTKRLSHLPVIAVGSVGLATDVMDSLVGTTEQGSAIGEDMGELVRRFERGDFDMVAVGRSLLGDAEWVNKVAAGEIDSIRPFRKDDLGEAAEIEPELIKAVHGFESEQPEGWGWGRTPD